MKVLKFPLISLILFFIAGIFTAKTFSVPAIHITISSASLLAILIVGYFGFRQWFANTLFGLVAASIFFCIGMLSVSVQVRSIYDFSHDENNFDNHKKIEIVLRQRLKSTDNNLRYIAIVKSIDGKYQQGRLLINIKKFGNNRIPIGTNMIVLAKIKEIKNHPNSTFDYAEYLRNKEVYGQVYTNQKFIAFLKKPDKNLWFYADAIRNRIQNVLVKNGMQENESSVAAALLLGQQQDISSEIKQDYQYAGAVHILAVSGLHVGFIALFVNLLIKRLPQNRRNRFLGLAVMLLSLWIFAFITGLTPSVVRASAMFSFIAIGINIRRITNIYNTIFISAFIILLFKPAFLFDVGFQLSYAAVFSIVWMQPRFLELWNPQNIFMKYFWGIITVSIAAQLGTLPIILYYFHQFPGLFIVTNLLVIPLLSVIMFLGIVVMAIAAIGYAIPFTVEILSFLISILNDVVHWVASIKTMIFLNIPFTIAMLLAAYIAIVFGLKWTEKFKFEYLAFTLVAIISFQYFTFRIPEFYTSSNEFSIMNSSRQTLISRRFEKTVNYFTTETSGEKMQKDYKLKSYNRLNEITESQIWPQRNVHSFGENKILIIDSAGVFPDDCDPNIIVLASSPRINLDRILMERNPKVIVADASNYKTYVDLWRKTCAKHKVEFHSTYEKGDFVLRD